MPDTIVTPPIATPAAPAKPRSVLDVITAARSKAIDPTVVAAPPVKKPETIATPVAKKPDVDDTAKKLADALAENEKLKAAFTGKEKEVTDLAAIREAQELWKSGKKVEAIAKLSGVDDPDGELDELVKAYVARPAKESKDAVTVKLEELEAEQKRIKDEREAEKTAAEKQKEQDKKAAADRAEKDAATYSASILAKNAEKFELCNKEKNRAEVCAKAGPIAVAILKRDEINFETITAEQGEKAMVEALSEIEKDLEKEGLERFWDRPAKVAKPSQNAAPSDESPVPRVASPGVKLETPGKAWDISTVLQKARQNATY